MVLGGFRSFHVLVTTLDLVEFPCAGKFFFSKTFGYKPRPPSRAQILIHFSFDLCKNRLAYS